MQKIAFPVIFMFLFGCHNNDVVTEFSERNTMEKEYYIYPSTLRMANLEKNEVFNEFIEDFKRGQYFIFTKNMDHELLIKDLKTEMAQEGFEEAMTMIQKQRNVSVFIQENKTPKIVAIMEEDSVYNIIQIEGIVNIAKLPSLIENFNDDAYLNVIDLFKKNQNNKDHGRHSQN